MPSGNVDQNYAGRLLFQLITVLLSPIRKLKELQGKTWPRLASVAVATCQQMPEPWGSWGHLPCTQTPDACQPRAPSLRIALGLPHEWGCCKSSLAPGRERGQPRARPSAWQSAWHQCGNHHPFGRACGNRGLIHFPMPLTWCRIKKWDGHYCSDVMP